MKSWLRIFGFFLLCGIPLLWGTVACQPDMAVSMERCPNGEIKTLFIHRIKEDITLRGTCVSRLVGGKPAYELELPCDNKAGFALPKLAEGEQLLFLFTRDAKKASYCETCKEGQNSDEKGQCSLKGPNPCVGQEICNNQEDDDCDGLVDEDCQSEPLKEGNPEPVAEPTVEVTKPNETITVDTKEITPEKETNLEPANEPTPEKETVADAGPENTEPDAGTENSEPDAGPDEPRHIKESNQSSLDSPSGTGESNSEQKVDPTKEQGPEKGFGDFGSVPVEKVTDRKILRTCLNDSNCRPTGERCVNGFCQPCPGDAVHCTGTPKGCGPKFPTGCPGTQTCFKDYCYTRCLNTCATLKKCVGGFFNKYCFTTCDPTKGIKNNPDCPTDFICGKHDGTDVCMYQK